MAEIYRNVGGVPIQEFMANNDGVQSALENISFEMYAVATNLLLKSRDTGDSQVEWSHAKVDWYVTLSDDRGQQAAASIEYGRAPSYNPATGKTDAGMEGLFILHKATHLRGAMRGKVKVPRARAS